MTWLFHPLRFLARLRLKWQAACESEYWRREAQQQAEHSHHLAQQLQRTQQILADSTAEVRKLRRENEDFRQLVKFPRTVAGFLSPGGNA